MTMASSMMTTMNNSMMWQASTTLLPWETRVQGFPHDVLLQQPVPEDYLCGICQLVLRGPMQSMCGHRFCMGCVQQQQQEVQCPVCQREPDEDLRLGSVTLGPDTVHPDNALRRMLMRQSARCPACADWTGTFGEYEATHYAECRAQTVLCPECGAGVTALLLDEHRARECQRRLVECACCGESVMAADAELHNAKNCAKVLVQCDVCTAPPMAREQLAQHYEKDCRVPKIPCPYGCTYVFVEPSKLEDHEQENIVEHTRIQNNTSTEMESVQCTELDESTSGHLSSQMTMNEIQQRMEHISSILEQRNTQGDVVAVPSSLTDIDKKLNSVDAKCGQQFEKIGALSAHTEHTEDFIMAGQLEVATFQRDDNKSLLKTERRLKLLEETFESLKKRLRHLEETSYNGTMLWSVHNFTVAQEKARDGRQPSLYSPIFYTSKYGYSLRMRLYPYGEGIARSRHMSIYLQLVPGEYDALHKWPFRQSVTFTVINQLRPGDGDLRSVFNPDGTATAFRRPSRVNDQGNGCTHFAPLAQFETGSDFVLNDTLFVKCEVDASGLD